jgi:hypothetical protein
VSEEGTKPDPGKVDVVVHFPVPKTVTNIKSFLGLCRTPTLAKCAGEAQHLEKSGVGVLRDS